MLKADGAEDAVSLAERSLVLAEAAGDRLDASLAKMALGKSRVLAGNDAGFDLMSEGVQGLRDLALPLPLVDALLDSAALRLQTAKDTVSALSLLTEARDVLSSLGLTKRELHTLLLAAETANNAGDLEKASELLDEARELRAKVDDKTADAEFSRVQQLVQKHLGGVQRG